MDETPDNSKQFEQHVTIEPTPLPTSQTKKTASQNKKKRFFNYGKTVLHITYLWVLIGFVCGTFLLLIPVRSLVGFLRFHHYSTTTENLIMTLIILGLMIITFLFAKWIHWWIVNGKRAISKAAFHVVLLMAFIGAIWFLLTPKRALPYTYIMSNSGQFIAGPYPSKEDMIRLKTEGFDTIVSLLNPLVVPFEPILIQRERENAKKYGIKLIEIPLLPWIGQNSKAFSEIKQLATSAGKKKFYVHCYLGQDRVWMFLTLVNKIATPYHNPDIPITLRKDTLERGYVLQLAKQQVIGPMPSEAEFPALLSRNPKNISSIPFTVFVSINAAGKDNPFTLVGSKKEFIATFGVRHYSYPIKSFPFNPKRVLDVVEKVKNIKGIVYIYDFLMPNKSTAAEAFILSYKTGLPAMPKQLLEKLEKGPMKLVAPNIVIGPTPKAEEFGQFFKDRGYESLIYVGPATDNDYIIDQKIAKFFNLNLRQYRADDPKLIELLASGGPWYLYGPGLKLIKPTIREKYRHLLPRNLPFYKSDFYRKKQKKK